jgi:predicted extracellular nuclease
MWRAGVTNRSAADRLDFQLSTDATSLLTGIWTDYNSLDFNSPNINTAAGLLNGNNAGNRTALSFTITGLTIPNGSTFWIRWTDFNINSSDDGLAVDDFSLIPLGVAADNAPSVSGTTPTGGATDVLLTDNVSVTFSEPVNVSGSWFGLSCATSGAHTAVVSGGPTTFTLDPDSDFVNSELCTLTVSAANVTDQDANDPPDAMVNDYTTSFTTIGPDNAPAVASTIPADGATNVPINQSVVVNFTEPVNVTDPWFSLTCATSGAHAATVTGGPTSFTLNPTVDFVYGELCTLTIDAAKIADQDSNDPPNNMVINFVAGFTTELDPCTLSYTPIYQIQGSGPSAAITGVVTTQGVVVGDYEYPGSGSTSAFLRGFFLQDLNGDANSGTSDAIFVFDGNTNGVNLGDIVRVTGTSSDFQDQTQISSVTSLRKCGTGTVVPVDVTFPVPSSTYLEQYEGMLVRLPQTMYVTEHFQLGRFGQVVLSVDGKLKQPTNVVAPGTPANALQAQNNLSKIILDDASQAQNPDPILFGRNGNPLSASNTLRGGDTATNIVGVMTYTWAGNAASGNAYRVRPVNALGGSVNFVEANSRPASAPNVGGNVRVVGMNLLNFFNTFSGCTAGVGGAATDCRGANSATEFTRQYQKTVAAILAMDPDVLGVNELENDGYGPSSSLQFLVDQLNAATAPGTYAFINVDAATGQVNAMGSDAIRVALLYKPTVVTPIGQTSPLNTVAFVNGGDGFPRSRPSLAQAFKLNSNNAVFIVDINHLKSKGSACDAPDAGDGQGNCNQVRVNAATELMNWLASDPTGAGDTDILLLGDYNSYAMEDPITVIKNAGFTNLIASFLGPDAYSYVFDGQWGYLDHALGSASLVPQVNAVGDYHINSDEPSVLDYNVEFKSAGQVTNLYAADQFRVSDHDSVVVGLQLNDPPTVDAGGPYTVAEGSSVTVSAVGSDPNNDSLTYEWDLDNDGSFETSGQSVSFSAASLDGPSSYFIKVKAADPGGLFAVSTAKVDVTNVAPTVTASFASNSVSCGPNNSTLNVSFTDPATADTHSAVINWGDGNTQTVTTAVSPFSLQHTYALAGSYTATVAVTDDDGSTGSTTAAVSVKFNTNGFLQPINADGTSVFKFGSTIPVKISFTNCDGSTPANLAPTIKLTTLSGSTPGLNINEPVSTSAADTTGVMRFSTNQYIYNLATKPLPDSSATYLITVTIPYNGQTVTAQYGLKP